MRNLRKIVIWLMVLFTIIVSGCAGENQAETPVLEASQTATVEYLPSATLEPTATVAPSPTPSPTEVAPIPCTITFDSDRDGNLEIYSMAPDGSQPTNLSNNPAYDIEPAWSPDGSQIVFVSSRTNPGQPDGNYLYIMNADGNAVRQLTFENDSASPEWSHDGSQIVYSHHADIYKIAADGSGQSIQLTNSLNLDLQPTWSPDGTRIAWMSGTDGNWNLFVMNADGSQPLQLSDNGRVYSVFWTIDGEVFSNWDHAEGICTKCVMNPDGSNLREAGGKGELQRYLPFKTANGERVECIQGSINTNNEEILLVSDIYPDIFLNLTNHPAMDRHPAWPANCLAGFEGLNPEVISLPPATITGAPAPLLFGYAGDQPEDWQRKINFQNACDELGITYRFGEIPGLLDENVNAIVLNASPQSIEWAAPDIRMALEKGVPVIVLDAQIDIPGVYSVTADHNEMLRTTLQGLLGEDGAEGEFAYFDFDPAQTEAQLIQGLLEKEFPNIRVVTTDARRYNFNQDPEIINDLLNDFPNLKALWTNDGYSNAVFGVVNYFSDPAQYPMLNCEANKEGFSIWKDRLVDYPEFECLTVSNPPGIAYDAVYLAHYLLDGAQIDPSALGGMYANAFLVDFPVVSNDNLMEVYTIIEYLGDDISVDQLMTPEEIRDQWFR